MKKAIVAIAAQFEVPYIKEFLQHYFSLGFDEAFIYLNNWNNDGLAYLKSTDFGGKVLFKLFDGQVKQLEAYDNFLQNYSSNFDWALFCDCDEFLKVRSNRSIDDILEMHSSIPSLVVNWRCFGNSHLDQIQDNDYSIRRFHLCEKSLNQHVKQFVNLNYCRQLCLLPRFMNPHFMNILAYNQEGHTIIGPWNRENLDKVHELELNHYITKSTEECKFRRSQVRADTPTPREEGWQSFFDRENKNEIEETSLVSI